MRVLTTARAAAALALGAALAGCSLANENDDEARTRSTGGAGGECGEVVLVTHDSFNLPPKLVERFERETGCALTPSPAGDGGELTNKLVLTRSEPLGDVAFGVDNTYASRAIEEGVFQPYRAELPSGADAHLLPGDDEGLLTPVDHASVCVNVDDAWFAERDLQPPATLEDLTDPRYEDLFVTPAATSSTPGMAFLLATVGHFGEDWTSYWEDLMANGAKVVKGWEDAYTVDFTYSGGDRPIVLSYDSSPAFTVEGGRSTTSALLDTCFRQVEYAGVLAGAENPDGAQRVVDWLLSPEVQAALPTSMYVFPVAEDVAVPKEWARFARQPTDPIEVDPAEITEHREEWLREWTEITTR